MSFFTEIALSALNPLFFRKAVQKSSVRAFVYYMIFTTIYTLAICGALFWWVSRQYAPTLELVENAIPPFEVKISEGHLSTTLPEPLVFSDADFGFVVDTSGKEHDIDAYEHAIVISKTKATVKKSKFETREYTWAVVPDFKLTTQDLVNWLLAHKATILWTLFTTLALGIFPLAWLFLIPVLLFIAVLLLVLGKIVGAPLRYGQTVSIAFYAITLPTLTLTAMVALGQTAWANQTTFWAIYLIWAAIGAVVCRGLTPEPVAPPTTLPPPALKK